MRRHGLTAITVFFLVLSACGDTDGGTQTTDTTGGSQTTVTTTGTGATTTAATTTTAVGSGEPFVIGVTAAATGPAAPFGKFEFDAAQLAADEINAAGGINGRMIELITEDDEAVPDKGASITQGFISRGVDAILGSASSGVALASVPIAEDAGMLYLAPMPANPAVTKNEDGSVRHWVFRVAQSDTDNAQFIAEYAFANFEKVALLSDTTGYGAGGRQALLAYIPTLGAELVADETYDTGTPDVTAQLQRIESSGADVLILWGISTDAAIVLQGIQAAGMTIQVVGMPGLGGSAVCDLAGDAAIGLRHLDTFDPGKPEAVQLSDKWQATYGAPLTNYFAASAYDGMYLLAHAFEVGGDDREAVRAALEAVSGYVGALGKTGAGISYSDTDHDGLALEAIVVKEIVDISCAREIVG